MNDYNFEHDLCSVMERRAERIPALSDDFAEQVMSKITASPPTPLPWERGDWQLTEVTLLPSPTGEGSGVRLLWVRFFSVAAILVLAFLLWPKGHETSQTPTSVLPAIVEVHTQPEPESSQVVEARGEEVLAEVTPTPQPVSKQRKATKKSAPIEEPTLAQAEPIIPVESASQPPVDDYSYNEGEMMAAGNVKDETKAQWYASEIRQEQATHQRQAAYEKEKRRRELELLMYLLSETEEDVPEGTVKTQKS
ncbi:MAG: hypothetical protein IJ767_00850 [Bacteroidaceae bacterium]|nr:hypothetical protein [Bacteroidaceae bacterium]